MGVHGLMSNNKKASTKIGLCKLRRVKRAERKKKKGFMVGEITDADRMIITSHILKKRRTSPRANITLSGKKRRKLLRQLKHMRKDANKMEVEVSALDAAVKTKKGKGASSAVASTSTATEVGNTSSANDDVEMQS